MTATGGVLLAIIGPVVVIQFLYAVTRGKPTRDHEDR